MMKTNITGLFTLFILLFASCEPVENRDKLGNLLSESELVFDIIQEPAGGNTVIFENKTPGVIPYFAWGGEYSNQPRTEAYIPFAGEYTVTFTAFTAGGPVSISKDFTVNQNDPEYFANPAWDLLTGNGAGKTWVIASDVPTSEFSGVFWGNGSYLGNWFSWSEDWGAKKDDYPRDMDINGEFYFDLEGGLNFQSTEHGKTATGSFNLQVADEDRVLTDAGEIWSIGKLDLAGASIPYGISVNEDNKIIYQFDICRLTEDELVLAYQNPSVDYGETWFWRFKRKGFNF